MATHLPTAHPNSFQASNTEHRTPNIQHRHSPERTCVGCRTRKGKGELIRFHVSQGSLQVTFGMEGGRGVYLCPSLRCVELALRRRAFQWALKGQVEAPDRDALLEMIRVGALKRIIRLLGLARRGGKVSLGRTAAETSLKKGRVHLLLLAPDAEAQDLAALKAKALASDVPVLALLTRGELGEALGKGELTVVAVKDPHFARGILGYAAWILEVGSRISDGRHPASNLQHPA